MFVSSWNPRVLGPQGGSALASGGPGSSFSQVVDCDADLDLSRKCVTISNVPGLLGCVTSLLPLVLGKACPKAATPALRQPGWCSTRGPGRHQSSLPLLPVPPGPPGPGQMGTCARCQVLLPAAAALTRRLGAGDSPPRQNCQAQASEGGLSAPAPSLPLHAPSADSWKTGPLAESACNGWSALALELRFYIL